MERIEELTQEQKDLMVEVRNEWIKKIERPNDLTIEKVKPHIEWLYEFCGLKKPEVIVADSPFSCQITANLPIKNQVWNQVGDQVEDQVEYQVGKQVRDQVRDHFKELKYISSCFFGDTKDSSWCSFYDFFARIGVVKNEYFQRYLEYLDVGIFYSIQLKDVNIVCGNPDYMDRDTATGELHSEDRMAIKWKDGWGLYFLRGVEFEEKLWKQVTSKTCHLKKILSIKNTEQRMSALSLEHNRLLLLNQMEEMDKKSMLQTNASLETVEVEYILYKLPQSVGIFNENSYFVFTTCPSTGRQYLEGVAPEVGVKGDVFECVASQFQITKQEFLNIGQHS